MVVLFLIKVPNHRIRSTTDCPGCTSNAANVSICDGARRSPPVGSRRGVSSMPSSRRHELKCGLRAQGAHAAHCTLECLMELSDAGKLYRQ
jgi:hypothetical protein